MSPAGSVLLDTNVVVAHFRNDPDLTMRLRGAPAVYLPWVVLGELHYGALRAQRREAQLALIREFVQTVILLLPDQSTSERYGHLKAELAAAGKLIPDNDIWIAAMARQYDLPLVTRDVHLAAVSRLKTLAWQTALARQFRSAWKRPRFICARALYTARCRYETSTVSSGRAVAALRSEAEQIHSRPSGPFWPS